MRMNGCKRNSNVSTPRNAKLTQIDGSANIGSKRDRRNLSIDAMESSTDQNIDVAENRSGIERRSCKDRRGDYNEQRKSLRSKLKPGAFVYLNQNTQHVGLISANLSPKIILENIQKTRNPSPQIGFQVSLSAFDNTKTQVL